MTKMETSSFKSSNILLSLTEFGKCQCLSLKNISLHFLKCLGLFFSLDTAK